MVKEIVSIFIVVIYKSPILIDKAI
jgi:hypothetical protein